MTKLFDLQSIQLQFANRNESILKNLVMGFERTFYEELKGKVS